MDILDKINEMCTNSSCSECRLSAPCNQFHLPPCDWDIDAIRKTFEEPVKKKKTADLKPIVIPEKWDNKEIEEFSCNIGYRAMACMLYKHNEIIDCLEQIKERLEK